MPSDWILAIETSVTEATIVLWADDGIVASRSFSSERSQECDLFGPLQDVLSQLPPEESLSLVLVGTGPGSYNGARVGIAAAQAIAHVHGCGVAGLCSFEGVPHAREHQHIWAVGDARRGSYFLLPLKDGRACPTPELLGEEELIHRLANCEGPKITFESPERLPGNYEYIRTSSIAENLVKSWLGRTAGEQQSLQNTPVEAFYLRPPHITKSKKKT